jgi:hypothetical protein
LSTEDINLDLLSLLPEKHQKVIEALLFANWATLAAFCYQSYLDQGRGLMLLHIRQNRITGDSVYLCWNVLKASWNHLMQGTDDLLQERIRQYVPAYDPLTEVALMIDFEDTEEGNCLVVKVDRMTISVFNSQPDSVIPTLKEYQLPSPKDAWELREKHDL